MQPLHTKKIKIFFIIFLFLLFFIFFGNTINAYAYSSVTNYYYFSDYSDLDNLELTLHSGTTYYFDNLPFDTDTLYYFIFGDDEYLSFICCTTSADYITSPALVLFLYSKAESDDYIYLRFMDEDTGTLYRTSTYYISYDKLSTDYLEPTDISENYDGHISGTPISVSSTHTSFSTFRIYYLTYNIYYTTLDYGNYTKTSTSIDLDDLSESSTTLFSQSVPLMTLSAATLSVIPTQMTTVMRIVLPVCLALFGMLFVVLLVRYLTSHLQ